jgi:hypothetical protein
VVVEGEAVGGGAWATRMVSLALPITMAAKMSLSAGEKAYLMPATSTEIMMKAAHILDNAMR